MQTDGKEKKNVAFFSERSNNDDDATTADTTETVISANYTVCQKK